MHKKRDSWIHSKLLKEVCFLMKFLIFLVFKALYEGLRHLGGVKIWAFIIIEAMCGVHVI